MYDINTLLKLIIESEASDLFISMAAYPMLKIKGKMIGLKESKITKEMLLDFYDQLLTEKQKEIYKIDQELDFSYALQDVGRFRVNCFTQRGSCAFVIHHIPEIIKSVDELNLPQIIHDIALEDRGLVLFVGSAGSGKSTSIAALIDFRNENKAGHILTLEDPIEFIHVHKESIVNQREIGQDSLSYQRALKSALREAPSVLLMGEIRDLNTITTAITLAETGHLVLSTMHATNTQVALERIFNIHGPEYQEALQQQLSENIAAVVAQRLVPTLDRGLIPAVEILLPSERIKELIRKGELHLINHSIESSNSEGMQSFDQCLINYYKEGKISAESAIRFADHKTDLLMLIKEQEWKGKEHKIKLDFSEEQI